MNLRKKFDDEMKEIYFKAKKEAGYNATRYYQMVMENDPLDVAKKLISYVPPSEGFTNLLMAGKLNLTVEALVVKEEYREFFTEEEIRLCKEKLGEDYLRQNSIK